MPRHGLKLIAIAALFSVAPALADHPSTGASQRHCCPHHRAAVTHDPVTSQRTQGGSTISLTDRVPEGSLLDFGFRHGIFTP